MPRIGHDYSGFSYSLPVRRIHLRLSSFPPPEFLPSPFFSPFIPIPPSNERWGGRRREALSLFLSLSLEWFAGREDEFQMEFLRFDSMREKLSIYIYISAREERGYSNFSTVWKRTRRVDVSKEFERFSRGRLKHDAGINAENFFSVPRISR